MKYQLLFTIIIFITLGLTTIDNKPNKYINVPGQVQMQRELSKINITSVKVTLLNEEIDNSLIMMDSINNALDNKKTLRKLKREIRRENRLQK